MEEIDRTGQVRRVIREFTRMSGCPRNPKKDSCTLQRTFVFLARHEAQPLLGFPQYTILDDIVDVAGMANMADTAWLGVSRKSSAKTTTASANLRN